MLFPRAVWDGLADGSVTVAFRRWRRPTVRAGGTLRAPTGVLAIDAVDVIAPDDVTDEDLRRAGEADRATLLARLARREGELYRIRFHYAGADPRPGLAEEVPTGEALAAVVARLDALDAASRRPPWTRELLALIAANPARLAAELAAELDRPTQPFKQDVRRLKELGLTISLPVGYRLSPRGEAVLAASRH